MMTGVAPDPPGRTAVGVEEAPRNNGEVTVRMTMAQLRPRSSCERPPRRGRDGFRSGRCPTSWLRRADESPCGARRARGPAVAVAPPAPVPPRSPPAAPARPGAEPRPAAPAGETAPGAV